MGILTSLTQGRFLYHQRQLAVASLTPPPEQVDAPTWGNVDRRFTSRSCSELQWWQYQWRTFKAISVRDWHLWQIGVVGSKRSIVSTRLHRFVACYLIFCRNSPKAKSDTFRPPRRCIPLRHKSSKNRTSNFLTSSRASFQWWRWFLIFLYERAPSFLSHVHDCDLPTASETKPDWRV